MKYTNAFWEKRNLGVTCEEIVVEHSDNIQDILNSCESLTAPYQVIKVPAGMADILLCLQEEGWKLIECNLSMRKLLTTENTIPEIYRKRLAEFYYKKVEKEHVAQVLSKIEEDQIFKTDKIACDPSFGIEKSNKRYALWSKDVLDDSGELFQVYMGDRPIGFFILNEQERSKYESFLAGVYAEYSRLPVGFSVLAFPIIEAQQKGAREIVTGTSSNNILSAKMHLFFGYELREIYYILIKHFTQKTF